MENLAVKGSILITGGTGYIGSQLATHLQSSGYSIILMVRNPDKVQVKDVNILEYESDAEKFLNTFPSNLTAVIHLASTINKENNISDIDNILSSNVILPARLLQAMAQKNCTQFINIGTYWQQIEKDREIANSIYAATKSSLKPIIDYHCHYHNLSALTLRLSDVYGQDDVRPKLLTQLKNSRDGETFSLTKGEQILYPLHITDVIRAIEISLDKVSRFDSQHLEYSIWGEKITLRTFIDNFCHITNKKIELKWGEKKYPKEQIFSPVHLTKLPGWEAKISLIEGFKMFNP